MQTKPILCFGEIVWDCLPQGDFLGGAPLNVAAHLRRLGWDSRIVSAVGDDLLGQEAAKRINSLGVGTQHLRILTDKPTGTVLAALDQEGNASYEIQKDVAWDNISLTPQLEADARRATAIVYGSLALRSPGNRQVLDTLAAHKTPLKVFDVNLRKPFDSVERVYHLAENADVLKLNEDELYQLLRTVHRESLEDALRTLSLKMGVATIVVTMGKEGAIALKEGNVFSAKPPKVIVKDTIGAGDAFTAALVDGLLSRRPMGDILDRACRLGALVASREGAIPDYNVATLFG